MTTGKDPLKYNGSGTVWKAHLKKHKCRNSVITVFYKLFTEKDRCTRFATLFSKFAKIVESSNWANLIIEDGINNGISSPNITDEIRSKMSKSHTGTKHSIERCNNISSALKGKSKSAEHVMRNSISQKSRKDSPDRGRKISDALKGRIVSSETGKNISMALKGKPKAIIKCTHCDKIGASGIMKRWHFDNCKIFTNFITESDD